MRYPVVTHKDPDSDYGVTVPDLPGCIATGSTVEHARQMIAEAIEMHLEQMLESGETLPQPSARMEFSVDDSSPEELCTWVEVESRERVSK